MKPIIGIIVFILFINTLHSATIHVPGDYGTIQEAIDITVEGDTIIVAPGSYVENLTISETIILKSSAGPDMTLIDGNHLDRVITVSGHEVVIDGFTIINGSAGVGGGIYAEYTDAGTEIRNNIIKNNTILGNGFGGGIYCSLGYAVITNNSIQLNDGYAGGGISIYAASIDSEYLIDSNLIDQNTAVVGAGLHANNVSEEKVMIQNNIITNNVANYPNTSGPAGGGVFANGTSFHLKDNTINNNITNACGGAVCVEYALDCEIENNYLLENTASYGGGVYVYVENSAILTGNVCKYNTALQDGGFIYCAAASPLELNNCLFVGNESQGSQYGGGVIYNQLSTVNINNCTLTKNSSATGTPMLIFSNTIPFTMTNCIFHGNVNSNLPFDTYWAGNINYSASEWDLISAGTGYIVADPLYVDTVNDDFHLQQNPCQPGVVNPCVDTGDPTTPLFEGTTRTDGAREAGIIDMGYHYPLPYPNVKRVPLEYSSIQSAIDDSEDGDVIVVSTGTYYETINYFGKDLEIRSDVDGDPETYDLDPENTVIDGNQINSVVRIRFCQGSNCALMGFTLTNGIGRSDEGGGVYITDSSPSISNNIIRNNAVSDEYYGRGGGIYCGYNSSPTIENNSIKENSSESRGGGIYCIDEASPIISNNHIEENTAGVHGGGIYCYNEVDATINGNVIKSNSSGEFGGGLFIGSCAPVLINNIIVENEAGTIGGGLYCWEDSAPIITNNTVAGNLADEGGGIGSESNGMPIVTNTILWNNTALIGKEIKVTSFGNLTISYSDVEGGQSSTDVESGGSLVWGLGMIDKDPLFANEASSDYHLTRRSPCTDEGDNSAPNIPGHDFEGQLRIIPVLRGIIADRSSAQGVVDIGADEYWGPRLQGSALLPSKIEN